MTGLRSFSRLDESEHKAVDVVEGLQTTLALLQTQFKNAVRFVRQYDVRPILECWTAQLNQAGYGGKVWKGSVKEGFQPTSLNAIFAADVATQPPLPENCAF